jgi:pimeloyl-ACP methyl ester carboxylesterase
LKAGDATLEWRRFGAPAGTGVILLHEGLGSISAWGRFPEMLAEGVGLPVFVYSRAGYGNSSPVKLPRPLDYMQREATDVLPTVIDTAGFRRVVLLGHSDGASIAAYYAGTVEDHRIAGLVLFAPHFFVEDVTVTEIAAVRDRYESELRPRLARHHADVDNAFWGWNGAWLDPRFRTEFDITGALPYIRVPVLIVQGEDDPYGSVDQLAAAARECVCPVECVLLPECGHAPHRDQPQATLAAVAEFIVHVVDGHATDA